MRAATENAALPVRLTGCGVALLCLLSSSPGLAAEDRFTVCSITINSADEIDTFRRYLPDPTFQFVELTKPWTEASAEPSTDWLPKACESGVRCDVLVVSGHFLTTFVGTSGLSLSLEELEQRACDESCPGILRSPLEVFLFGCKTLATREQDLSIPQQDLRAFTTSGVSASTAERIVEEAPFGGSGETNLERMRFVFTGVPRLYGFSSIGPSGETVKPLLEGYFQSVGDYAEHLRQIAHSRRPPDPTDPRVDPFIRSLQPSSVEQCGGLDPADPDYARSTRGCFLKSERHPVLDRLERVETLLEDRDFLSHLPAIEWFFHRHKPASFGPSELAVLQRIRKNQRAREPFLRMIYGVETPVIRLEMLSVARSFGWMNDDEALGLEREVVLGVLRPPIYGHGRDLVCGIDPDLVSRIQIRADELPSEVYTDEFGIQALGCLKPSDERIHVLLGRSLFDSREWIARYAAIALKAMKPARVEVQVALARQLGRPETALRRWAAEALREIRASDPVVLETIRSADPSFQIDWSVAGEQAPSGDGPPVDGAVARLAS